MQKSSPPKKDKTTIDNKYQLVKKLKRGGFGEVYIAKGLGEDYNKYAIKLMSKKNQRYANIELKLYKIIRDNKYSLGFIKYYDHGMYNDYIYLAMELIGLDLQQIMQKMKAKKFSLKTVLMFALQAIDRIEALHKIGYVHRDIKPDNFAIGNKEQNNLIYLFDFGLSIKDADPVVPEEKGLMVGTLHYMSTRCHEGKKATYIDDIESFMYTLFYMATGALPWAAIPIKTPADYQKIKVSKEKISLDWIIKNGMPPEFYDVWRICREATTKSKIDYLAIKYKFLAALRNIKQQNDFSFDWCGVFKVVHEDSPQKLIQQRKKMNQLNKSNQKLIQNEIFQIYKFIDGEKGEFENEKQVRKDENKHKSPLRKPAVENKRLSPKKNKVQQKPVQKRPQSQKNERCATAGKPKRQILDEVERHYQKIASMKFQGPKIIINRNLASKI